MRLVRVLVLTATLGLLPGTATQGGEERATAPPGGMPPDERLEADLTQWLAKRDDLHAAWAGWIVAEKRIGTLAGAVQDRLVRQATGQGPRRPAYFVEAALLDALVRIGATLPGETLTRLAASHIEAVTVLLCRRHAVDPAHLAVFRMVGRGLDYEAYVAIGNALATWRVPAFTARILTQMELRRRVRIWDRDPPYPSFRGPSDSVPGDGFFRVPDGFPPVADYSLSFLEYEWAKWQLLADGPRRVYTRRTVTRNDMIGFGGSGDWPEPRDEYRHEWLTAFLEAAEVPPLPIYATIDLKWTGGRQPWERRTRQAVEDLHTKFRTWRDALHARGLLTDEGRETVRPKISLEIHDNRRLQRAPLPPFPKVPFDPRVPPPRPRRPKGDI